MPPKNWLVTIGDFLFKYRNVLFPVFVVLICAIRPPVTTYDVQGNPNHFREFLAVGIMLFGLGIRAAVIGYKYIKRGGLNKKVYAENLVTDGFFATCRNPLYVGNVMMYISMFVMHGDPLVFIIGMAVFLFIYTAIIAAEEYFLREKFGEAFEAYCRDVPRWMPHLNRLRGATQGMQFNWGRVLAKDYTTVVNGLFSLMVIHAWKQSAANLPINWVLYIVVLVVMIGVLAAVKTAKKRGLFRAV